MNILVVLALLVVFGLLRFRGANLFTWALAWWVGCYVLFRFGFAAPIPSSVISIYMGIVTLAILAFVSSSYERREEISRPLFRLITEKKYAPLLAATVIAIPALAAANVYVQMNVPIEPPFFPRTVHPASPPDVTVHDKRIAIETGNSPLPATRDVRTRKKISASTSRTAAGSTTRTASSATATTWAATACSCTAWIRSRPTSPTATRLPIFRDVSLLARGQGRPRTAGRRRAMGLGDAGLGEVPEGRGAMGRPPLYLRFHGREASRPGGAPMTSRPKVAGGGRCPVGLGVCLDDWNDGIDGADGDGAARARS